jgi:hypothetical protein
LLEKQRWFIVYDYLIYILAFAAAHDLRRTAAMLLLLFILQPSGP